MFDGSSRGSFSTEGGEQLERLCSACLPDVGVDGGGVSVLSAAGLPVAVHATDPVAALIEELQFTLGEGPCLEASTSGAPVLVPDLARVAETRQRWPAFTAEARSAGVAAVFAFPIRIGTVALGSMDLYRGEAGPLSTGQLAAGLSTVDEVGACLIARGSSETDPLDGYPMTVHQAAGMVMVQLGSSIEVALVRLRASAYAEGTTLTHVAADVLDGRRRFVEEQ